MELLQLNTEMVTSVILFLAAQTIVFIATCVTIYVRIMTRMKELEVRVKMMEKNESEVRDKLDQLLESNHRIELKLANKQDRN